MKNYLSSRVSISIFLSLSSFRSRLQRCSSGCNRASSLRSLLPTSNGLETSDLHLEVLDSQLYQTDVGIQEQQRGGRVEPPSRDVAIHALRSGTGSVHVSGCHLVRQPDADEPRLQRRLPSSYCTSPRRDSNPRPQPHQQQCKPRCSTAAATELVENGVEHDGRIVLFVVVVFFGVDTTSVAQQFDDLDNSCRLPISIIMVTHLSSISVNIFL